MKASSWQLRATYAGEILNMRVADTGPGIRLRALSCGLILLSVALATPNAARGESTPDWRQVDAIFEKWNRWDTPGAALAVVREGKVIYTRGYGSAHLEYPIPITPETVFHVASVSKQFTCFAVILLAQEGKLLLDDDIHKHLSELPDFGHTITIRHLMHHTSGLRDQWQLLAIAGWRLDDVITQDHIMKLVRKQRGLNFEPGSEHLYSNTGYTLLAEIVARVSGKSFAEFTDERIFKPLGMSSTHFHDDHERIVPNRAYSYSHGSKGYRNSVLSFANVGATSLFTTVEDLARWLTNLDDARVGGREVTRLMHERGTLTSGKTLAYASGLTYGQHRGLEIVGHDGSDAGYRSSAIRVPQHKLGVVVLSNLSTFNPGQVGKRVVEVVLADQLEPKQAQHDHAVPDIAPNEAPERLVGDDAVSTQPPNDPPPTNSGQAAAPTETKEKNEPDLSTYVGSYYSPELETTYKIELREGKLVACHQRHPDVVLRPLSTDKFIANSFYFPTAQFERGDDGHIRGMRLSGVRVRNVVFERRSAP